MTRPTTKASKKRRRLIASQGHIAFTGWWRKSPLPANPRRSAVFPRWYIIADDRGLQEIVSDIQRLRRGMRRSLRTKACNLRIFRSPPLSLFALRAVSKRVAPALLQGSYRKLANPTVNSEVPDRKVGAFACAYALVRAGLAAARASRGEREARCPRSLGLARSRLGRKVSRRIERPGTMPESLVN